MDSFIFVVFVVPIVFNFLCFFILESQIMNLISFLLGITIERASSQQQRRQYRLIETLLT